MLESEHHGHRPTSRRRSQRWIVDGKPLRLAPEAIGKGTRPKTALQIALETGQHSLSSLLLKSGYRFELERYAPLDLALQARRWDLFDLRVPPVSTAHPGGVTSVAGILQRTAGDRPIDIVMSFD